MKIDNINVDIFHRKDTTKIEASFLRENYYSLGLKHDDDTFKVKFESSYDEKFLIFFEHRDGSYEHIVEINGQVNAEISMHRKLILVTIKPGGIAIQYRLEIKHENHQSLLCFSKTKEIKIFLHSSNGLPDSQDVDRKKHQVMLNLIFSQMNESDFK